MVRPTDAYEIQVMDDNEMEEETDDLDDLYGVDAEEEVDEEGEKGLFFYEETSANLVPVFAEHAKGRESMRDVQAEVYENFTQAKDSTEEYRERMGKDWKLFAGELPPKSFPFNKSANPNVPLMLENLTRLTSRVESEIFGDWSRIYGVIPLSDDDQGVADILTLHGNWQLREDIPDFSRQMSRALMAFFIFGDVTCHSFYDERRKRNKHEVLTCDDFYVPYVHITTEPDYSDCPYYVKVLHLYRHELEAHRDDWSGVKELLDGEPPEWEDEPEAVFRESAIETTSIIAPDRSAPSPYKILQYEGWMDLPGQDRQRFCQVIMDYSSKTLLKLTIHEEDDWQDRIRHDREWKELAAHRQALKDYPLLHSQWENQQMRLRQDAVDPTLGGETGMVQAMQAATEMPPPMLPVAPTWLEDPDAEPKPARRVPIHMFSHGVCIENMAGSVGLSFGRIQADFNRSANVLTSQFIDSATLGNCSTLLTTDQVEFETPFEMAPGKVHKVSGITGQDLKANMMELKPQPANPQMMQMVDKIMDWASSSIQSPAVLSGEAGKSGETYRGLASRIEQATKAISVPARRFATIFLRQVLINNGRLNSIWLPETQILQVVDLTSDPKMKQVRIDRSMYARDYKVAIRADLRFTSEGQRVQERLELLQLPAVVPQLQGNAAWTYGALIKYLQARKDMDMVPLLGTAPEKPDAPFGAMAPPMPGAPGAPGAEGGGPPPPTGTPGPGGQPAGEPVPGEPGR